MHFHNRLCWKKKYFKWHTLSQSAFDYMPNETNIPVIFLSIFWWPCSIVFILRLLYFLHNILCTKLPGPIMHVSNYFTYRKKDKNGCHISYKFNFTEKYNWCGVWNQKHCYSSYISSTYGYSLLRIYFSYKRKLVYNMAYY